MASAQESRSLLAPTQGAPQGDNPLGTRAQRLASCILPAVIVTYFLAYISSILVLNPYLYDVIAEEYDPFNSSAEHPCSKEVNQSIVNTTAKKTQEEIEKRVATIELYLGFCSFLLATVPVLILGPMSDKYGRKLGFIFPIVGTFLKQIVYVFVMKFKLSPMVFFAAHIFEAIGGSFAAMLACMFTMTSDLTTPGRQRSFRIAVMEALQTLTASVGQITVAQWIRHSYEQPLYYAMGMSVVSFVLAMFLPETHWVTRLRVPRGMIRESRLAGCAKAVCTFLMSCFKNLKKSIRLYYKDDSARNRLTKRNLCLWVFILTIAVNMSKPGVQNLFLLKYPLCWSQTKIYTFGGVQLVCNWLVILAVLALLQKLFKMPDRHVAIIGVLSSLISAVFMSLATNDTMVYEVAALSVMIRSIIPMLRSILSSLVDSTDQGALFASLGCIETFGAAVFSFAANRLYYVTLSTWAGGVFILFAGFMAVAFVLLIILNSISSKEESQTGNGHQEVAYESIN